MFTNLNQIRLGIINPLPSVRDEHGQIWVNRPIGRLLEELRRHLPKTLLCTPIVREFNASVNHKLNFPNDALVPLPPLESVIKAQKYYFPTRRALRGFAASVDALFMRLPFQLPSLLRNLGRPKLLHVVGNTREVVALSSDYQGAVKWAARGFAWFSEYQTKRLVREPNTRVATNGTEMWHKLGCRDGRVVVSSCLYQGEMEPRESPTLNDPPRILFVGYLRPEKGVLTLLDAFDELHAKRPLQLTLVGGMDRHSNAERIVRERIDNSSYRADISMTGMVDFGPRLFSLYREHDLCIVPSLSEGTPRTVVEAQSFGCPVIASRVGGIPDSVTHERTGLLFEPGNARELARSMSRVLDDEPLRGTLMIEGFRTAKQHSVEKFAVELVTEVAALFGLPGPSCDQATQTALTGN